MINIPLEIYIYIINILLVGIVIIWYFYGHKINKYKTIFIWLTILFFINLLNIRITLKDYLKNSQKIGAKGTKGVIGDKGSSGLNKDCGCIDCDNKTNHIIFKLKEEAKRWTNFLLSYNQGVNFLKDYFYIDYTWNTLLSKPNETLNPFDLIKQNSYWK